MPDGQAEKAVIQAMASSNLNLVGLHSHLGSPIFETQPYEEAVTMLLEFAARMKKQHGFVMREFSPGGGFAVQYLVERPAPAIADYAQAIVSALQVGCKRLGLELPRLVLEPGRSIVGRAGVALYRTGASKEIPGVRKYVSLDGGMADNIRPALYEAKYEAVLANRIIAGNKEVVSLAGKFCESGDILIRDIELPRLSQGDIIAIPASGAYCLSMASNYNCALKPAIVLVKDGKANLIRRRESFEDLMRNDVV
jgi:diaminopimelate decarboxylase